MGMNTVARKPVIAAMATAVALLIASGAGYRVLAGYLDRPSDSAPMTLEELNRLPKLIGQWRGEDLELSEAVIRATSADAYVCRVYRRGAETVVLFVAYGGRARDLMPHRPEVCYPGAGWTRQASDGLLLPLATGSELPCRVYRFDRGGLGQNTVVVLNYYIIDGQYSPDVSLLRSKARWGSEGIRYMAQVQISSTSEQHKLYYDDAVRSVQDFAKAFTPELRAVLPDAAEMLLGPGEDSARD
ncbi:MAG: EpsI family protein [Planctomycetes bacterium]|nr:EpsI family protein [Planctomycetota bacterium]